MNIKPGIYQHYKGGKYRVHDIARYSENPHEHYVIYEQLYNSQLDANTNLPTGTKWIRPLSMFAEYIIKEGVQVPRFKLIEEEE